MSLPRSLTLFSATMLVVGNVVGAGIFTTASFLAGQVAQPSVFLLVWVVGGLLTLCGTFTYAELGAMFPRAGGDYQYLKEAYGPLAGFLLGWLAFWVISPGSIAALSIGMVGYMPWSSKVGPLAQKAMAAGVVVVLSGLSYRGTRLARTIQDWATLLSVVLLVALVLGGVLWGRGDVAHFRSSVAWAGTLPLLSGSALIAVVFTYSGWFASAYLGSEIEHPRRNLPLSLLIGTAIVTVLYAAVNATYLYALPLGEMVGAMNVAQLTAERLLPARLAGLVGLAILFAIASCINASIMAGARICYAMARDGIFWARLGSVHPRHDTPHMAIVAQGVLSLALVALGTFDALLGYVVFAMLLTCIATGLAQIVLRLRRPRLPRPFRTPAYPLLPVIFISGYLWIAASVLVDQPLPSLLGLALAASGVPFYFWWRAKGGGSPDAR